MTIQTDTLSARHSIAAALRETEPAIVRALLATARLDPAAEASASALARRLVIRLRARGTRGPVEGLMREYALSSSEGIALMCLAEALLRTPDRATRDALIREGIAAGDWRAHLGRSPSLFVNATSWGLLLTGRLQSVPGEEGLARALASVVAKGGQPMIRRALDLAMRLMGDHFVLGETIEQALARARAPEARGFRYSYDMLGEGAVTADDAARYEVSYRHALRRIGEAACGGEGASAAHRPGLSIKLSALHPRYVLNHRARVLAELVPRLASLVGEAARFGIGINIDAEEADRLDLSLDVLDALCRDRTLGARDTLGFVVQAYGKRAPFVIDHLGELARRTGRRIAVRLVKGAYWDSEIKRAQEQGLDGFPVFTRKTHTDLSYVSCARRMLDAASHLYPQFATHNARTLATVHAMASADAPRDAYEFQCLHGMGEALYEDVVAPSGLDRPCRIYAPVGTHETLLAYLVRRLLENGANTSFVNRITDPAVPVDDLVADPAALIEREAMPGGSHPSIALPPFLHGATRRDARGFDLADGETRARLRAAAATTAPAPPIPDPCEDPFGRTRVAWPLWFGRGAASRSAILGRAADAIEAATDHLVGPLASEAGKTIPNAVSELREAGDFLRFYAAEARLRGDAARPLGTVVCISPWNFPIAIFTGQVAAALAAGNAVIAKPAPETASLAARIVPILHEAGVPADALVLVDGGAEAGAALVSDPGVDGVMFTGSTAAANGINRTLAAHAEARGEVVPLIAETGGQNAMIVDSSALAEQVVADVVVSAFDSAGQRCSALRVLCLQEEVADRILAMIRGAADELTLGDPALFETDIGPVITGSAADRIEAHLDAMAALGLPVHRHGRIAHEFASSPRIVRPAVVELDRIDRLSGEVFGPVLHVVRWQRDRLDALLADLVASGYALTAGVHTRLDALVAHVERALPAGNLYVNRNMIGAVVGVQPFGGHGLSGTGPKAGGPLTLRRLVRNPPPLEGALAKGTAPSVAHRFVDALEAAGHPFAARARAIARATPLGATETLSGPVGERNLYRLESRGAVLCRAATEEGALLALAAVLATGGTVQPDGEFPCPAVARSFMTEGAAGSAPAEIALFEGGKEALGAWTRALAEREGPIISVLRIEEGASPPLERLCRERHTSTNTAAAGGNASLMAIG